MAEKKNGINKALEKMHLGISWMKDGKKEKGESWLKGKEHTVNTSFL